MKVLMFNLSNKPVVFCIGDKVAQMTFQEANEPDIIGVRKLGETDRGKEGFGSTGAHHEQNVTGGHGEKGGDDSTRSATLGVKESSPQTVKPEGAKPDPQKYRLKQRPCDYIRTIKGGKIRGGKSTCDGREPEQGG